MRLPQGLGRCGFKGRRRHLGLRMKSRKRDTQKLKEEINQGLQEFAENQKEKQHRAKGALERLRINLIKACEHASLEQMRKIWDFVGRT